MSKVSKPNLVRLHLGGSPRGRPTPDMVRRQEAIGHTLKRFRNKDFDWQRGVNCVPMAWFHLKKMGRKPPKLPPFRSAGGALKALKALGHADCLELLDSVPGIKRIAPAEMMMGDLCVVRGGLHDEDEQSPVNLAFAAIGAVALCLGPHKIIGWRTDAGKRLVVLDVGFDEITAAWKV